MRNDSARSATGATTIGLLTATGAESVYDTTIIIHFGIKGIGYRKATVSGGTTPVVDQAAVALVDLAASEGCILVWCLNAAGAVSLAQSDVVALDAGTDEFDDDVPDFPDIDLDTYCPFAFSVLLNAAAGSTFDIGTDNWNQTGMTATHSNVLQGLPARRPIV